MTDNSQNDWFSAISLLIESSKKLELLLGKDWTKKLYDREAQTIDVENALDNYDKAFLNLRSRMAPHTVIPGVESVDDIEGWRELGKRDKYPVIDKLKMARDHYDEEGRDYHDEESRECADLITLLLEFPFFKPDDWFKKEDDIEILRIKGAGIPSWLSNRYKEAIYAYVYGFNNAAIAICRSIVEGILSKKYNIKNINLYNMTEFHINSIKDKKRQQATYNTNKIRILAKNVLHNIDKSATNNEAKEVIYKTKDFIQAEY